jgi:hypothetical protein
MVKAIGEFAKAFRANMEGDSHFSVATLLLRLFAQFILRKNYTYGPKTYTVFREKGF